MHSSLLTYGERFRFLRTLTMSTALTSPWLKRRPIRLHGGDLMYHPVLEFNTSCDCLSFDDLHLYIISVCCEEARLDFEMSWPFQGCKRSSQLFFTRYEFPRKF